MSTWKRLIVADEIEVFSGQSSSQAAGKQFTIPGHTIGHGATGTHCLNHQGDWVWVNTSTTGNPDSGSDHLRSTILSSKDMSTIGDSDIGKVLSIAKVDPQINVTVAGNGSHVTVTMPPLEYHKLSVGDHFVITNSSIAGYNVAYSDSTVVTAVDSSTNKRWFTYSSTTTGHSTTQIKFQHGAPTYFEVDTIDNTATVADHSIALSKLPEINAYKVIGNITSGPGQSGDAEEVPIDQYPTENSNNLVKSHGVFSYIDTFGGSANIDTVGDIGTGTWNGDAIADGKISSAATWNAKQDALTFGKSSGNSLKSEEALATDDVMVMGTSHVKGRTFAELKSDLSLAKADVGLSNVTNDAQLPLAGGTMTGDITMPNNDKIIFGHVDEYITGDGTDLKITSSGKAIFDTTGGIVSDQSLLLQKTHTSTGPSIVLQVEHSTNPNGNMSDGDMIGDILFKSKDDNGEMVTFGKIACSAGDVTENSEEGRMSFYAMGNDYADLNVSPHEFLRAQGNDNVYNNVDVYVGTGLGSTVNVGAELFKITRNTIGYTSADRGHIKLTPGDQNASINTSFQMESHADEGDLFNITTKTHGETIISTVDDDATAAHVTIDADGDITLDAASGNIYVKDNGGNYTPGSDYEIATKKYVDDNAGSVTVDSSITDGSTNPVENNAVHDALATKLNLSGGTMTGNVDFGDNDITNVDSLDTDKLSIAGGTEMVGIFDEDDMAHDSDVALATQQSIKAYVDANAGGADRFVISNMWRWSLKANKWVAGYNSNYYKSSEYWGLTTTKSGSNYTDTGCSAWASLSYSDFVAPRACTVKRFTATAYQNTSTADCLIGLWKVTPATQTNHAGNFTCDYIGGLEFIAATDTSSMHAPQSTTSFESGVNLAQGDLLVTAATPTGGSTDYTYWYISQSIEIEFD